MSDLESMAKAMSSFTPNRRSVLAGLATLPFISVVVQAQEDYPNRPIRLIVAYPAGTGTDATARKLANELQTVLGQPVVVENLPGGNAFIGAEAAAKAEPDGYTLLMGADHIFCFNPALFSTLPYDPINDFTAVAGVVRAPYLLAVNADLPVNSIAELIELAKSKPGELTFASTGIGTSSQLIGEVFKAKAGIELTHVPYQAGAQLFTDLLSGIVSMSFYPYQQFQPHIESGGVRILGVATDERWDVLPDVPTFNEAGFPDLNMAAFLSVFAPAGTDPAQVAKLSAAIKTVLDKPEVAEPFAAVGFPTAYKNPEEMTAFNLAEMDKCKAIVDLAGVKLD